MSNATTNANIVFNAYWNEATLHDIDGSVCDEMTSSDPWVSPDFTTLKEALEWAKAEAAKDKLEICTGTRYGNGSVTRNVYEIYAYVYDEDEEEWVSCSYEGEPWEDNDNEVIDVIDVLDLHPEVKKAWQRANGSFCKWLDYADGGEGYCGFRMALEDELGEDWDELDYIRWMG